MVDSVSEDHDSRIQLTLDDVENTFKKISVDGTLDVELWLDDFEGVATSFHWDRMQKFICY